MKEVVLDVCGVSHWSCWLSPKGRVVLRMYPNCFPIFLFLTGSKMTLPCKVFVGLSSHFQTDVEWLANDTRVDVVYKQSRVKEGERQ